MDGGEGKGYVRDNEVRTAGFGDHERYHLDRLAHAHLIREQTATIHTKLLQQHQPNHD